MAPTLVIEIGDKTGADLSACTDSESDLSEGETDVEFDLDTLMLGTEIGASGGNFISALEDGCS